MVCKEFVKIFHNKRISALLKHSGRAVGRVGALGAVGGGADAFVMVMLWNKCTHTTHFMHIL